MASTKVIVLITGANSGIGFEAAAALGPKSDEYHVLLGVRSQAKGDTALKALKAREPSGSFSVIQLDVTKSDSITSAVQSISQEYGRLDILVNNAGITVQGKPLLEDLRETFETNTFGPAATTEAFLPLLEKSADPRIIYTTSDLGSITWRADPDNYANYVDALAYRMSKAALNMLMVSQHSLWRREGKRIKSWVYNPGYTISNLTGEEGVEVRKQTGAMETHIPGKALADLINGKMGGNDVGKMVDWKGRVVPW